MATGWPHFLAELRGELVSRAAGGAGYFQPRSAFLAKQGISGVLVPTPGTQHSGPPDSLTAKRLERWAD
jgi:hypothetical protein